MEIDVNIIFISIFFVFQLRLCHEHLFYSFNHSNWWRHNL